MAAKGATRAMTRKTIQYTMQNVIKAQVHIALWVFTLYRLICVMCQCVRMCVCVCVCLFVCVCMCERLEIVGGDKTLQIKHLHDENHCP